MVAAAGNTSGECAQQNPLSGPKRPGTPDWDTVHTVVSPAWYDDYVLTVGSVSTTGAPSQFSLAGPWVDVAAPGESVVSLSAQGDGLVDSRPDSRPLSGTSYAAPVVSGVVALLRSRLPQLSARQVMARIKDTARHPADARSRPSAIAPNRLPLHRHLHRGGRRRRDRAPAATALADRTYGLLPCPWLEACVAPCRFECPDRHLAGSGAGSAANDDSRVCLRAMRAGPATYHAAAASSTARKIHGITSAGQSGIGYTLR